MGEFGLFMHHDLTLVFVSDGLTKGSREEGCDGLGGGGMTSGGVMGTAMINCWRAAVVQYHTFASDDDECLALS